MGDVRREKGDGGRYKYTSDINAVTSYKLEVTALMIESIRIPVLCASLQFL